MKKNIWMYGKHVVNAVIKNPKRTINQVWVTTKTSDNVNKTITNKSLVHVKDPKHFVEKFGKQSQHQNYAVETEQIDTNLKNIIANTNDRSLIVVLDQINNPYNIGAIVRSSAAFGANAVVLTKQHSPSDYNLIANASSGATEVCPIVYTSNLSQSIKILKKHQIWLCGVEESTKLISNIFKTKSINSSFISWKTQNTYNRNAIILGSEEKGLRDLTKSECDYFISIPTNKEFTTLNVSIAAAIVLYSFSKIT